MRLSVIPAEAGIQIFQPKIGLAPILKFRSW